MSLIDGHVFSLDAQLDNLWQRIADKLHDEGISLDSFGNPDGVKGSTQQLPELQGIIRSLSATSKSQPLLRAEKLLSLLRQSPLTQLETPTAGSEAYAKDAADLSWLVVAKAAVQILGLVIQFYLEQSLVVNDELSYWDDIQSSIWYTCVYTVQTSPLRIWYKIQRSYSDQASDRRFSGSASLISAQWAQLYNRMQKVVVSASTCSAPQRMPSLLSASKSQVRQKQKHLKAMKFKYVSSIGFLMEECFALRTDGGLSGPDVHSLTGEQLCNMVSKNVILMEKILQTSGDSISEFEETTLATIEREADTQSQAQGSYSALQPGFVIDRLVYILQDLLPNSKAFSGMSIKTHGRPSLVTRYWLPFALGFCTANTFIKIWISQRAKLLSWVVDIGSTTIRFWSNWVVEPIEKLIKTIRHDEGSEIALMSKNSLEADRASLERMVVDFVIDRDSSNGDMAQATTDAITIKVREGDLTPVLKAYERDLRAPFVGTVRGDLVRALLIQIQKTKVDVELAMSGIDSLLKSQELVFGFVGLTPGILVSYAVFRWVWGLVGNKKGLRLGRKQDELTLALRNVHRILTSSRVTNGRLSNRDHGLLICETEALLSKGRLILNRADLQGFQEDIKDLVNVQRGIDRQLQVIERIRWGYTKRLHRLGL